MVMPELVAEVVNSSETIVISQVTKLPPTGAEKVGPTLDFSPLIDHPIVATTPMPSGSETV
jgi:hypothetical protein